SGRGTPAPQSVQMARDAAAKAANFASAAPPVKVPNVSGIDMPTRGELGAPGRTAAAGATIIGADYLISQAVGERRRAGR
ncbi:amidophosphoribosyltransferase, partial [Burkholderia pseudomallei]